MGNPPSFALSPHPHASRHRQRLVAKSESNLPTHLRPGKGCNICPDLVSWSRSASLFSDRDATRHSRRGLGGSIARNLRRLIDDTLFLFCMASRRRRGNPIFVLRLLRLSRKTCTEQEPVNSHRLPGHHFYALVGLGCFWLGYSGWGFKLFDRHMDFMALRHTFSQFITHQCKILHCNISGAEVLSFTNCQRRQKKIGVSNVNVRQQRAIHQQS